MRNPVSGYSLLEICLVISLLIMLGTSGISHIRNWRDNLLLRFTAQAFTSELNRARIVSIACGFPVEVRIREDRKAYSLGLRDRKARFNEYSLPDSVQFQGQPRKPIVFYSSGNCTPAGTYVIRTGDKSIKVVVSIMGRARWEYL